MHGLKYEGWRELAPLMAELMERRLLTALDALDDLDEYVVTCVPTSAAHRRRRGYDQAELLARALSGRTGLPFAHLLARGRQKRTQVSLHPQQRMANVRDAFSHRPADGQPAGGRDVLLVDDVLTTGGHRPGGPPRRSPRAGWAGSRWSPSRGPFRVSLFLEL